MLSARSAALRLECAPDYVGRLCREGKLSGVRNSKGWFVDEESIVRFEAERAEARVEHSRKLSEIRREESKQFQTANSLLPASVFGSLFNHHVRMGALAALVGVLLLGSVSLGASGVFGGVPLGAALSQIDSPFFGSGAPKVSLPDFGSSISSGIKGLWAKVFGPGEQVPVAKTPAAPLRRRRRIRQLR